MTKTARVRKRLRAIFTSRLGKLIPILVIAGLVAAASSTVFTLYYGSATATVKTPDVTLAAGPDASASCAAYPCATVTIAPTNDFATIGLSFFPSVSNSPQPATYYTNLLQVHNGGTTSHTINSVTVGGVADSLSSLGSITVYYCSVQTETPATSASCDSFDITSTTGGSLSGHSVLPQILTAGSTAYIEIVAYAASTATAAHTTTFAVTISWV
jgi:hypothetical protein